ncbi:MAG: helix-turn-helix domain-containing protein [Gammaproteobacteria bacterium]
MSEACWGLIANQVVAVRKQVGITQAELAKRIGVDQSHISRLERGRKGISVELLVRIAEELEVPVGRLFGEGQTADASDAPASEALGLIESWIALPGDQRRMVKQMLSALRASSKVN